MQELQFAPSVESYKTQTLQWMGGARAEAVGGKLVPRTRAFVQDYL